MSKCGHAQQNPLAIAAPTGPACRRLRAAPPQHTEQLCRSLRPGPPSFPAPCSSGGPVGTSAGGRGAPGGRTTDHRALDMACLDEGLEAPLALVQVCTSRMDAGAAALSPFGGG